MHTNIGALLAKRAYMNPTNEALFDVAAGRRFSCRLGNHRRPADNLGDDYNLPSAIGKIATHLT